MPDSTDLPPVLITGATSPIAGAYATICAKRGQPILLAGRDLSKVERVAQDLRVRHAALVTVVAYDAGETGSGVALAQRATQEGAGSAVAFHGVMAGAEDLGPMMRVNCISIAELFEALLAEADKQGRKLTLAAVSSVAGDRGRQSNYPYACTKAALATYLSGLRNRVHAAGHGVVTIKIGYVRGRAADSKVSQRSPLLAEPMRVAADLDKAMRCRSGTVYTPWFWRGIMLVIRLIPEPVFKRLKL